MQLLKKGITLLGGTAVIAATAAAAGLFDVPAQVAGEWSYTSIVGTSFWDTSTGKYLGHGGGNSETFVFGKDGTFKDFVYMERSPSAGWTTQYITTMEGRAEWTGNTVKLIPSKGHYLVKDNRVARYNIDRDMTSADLTRMVKNYNYSLSTDNGKPVFVITFNDGSKMTYKKK